MEERFLTHDDGHSSQCLDNRLFKISSFIQTGTFGASHARRNRFSDSQQVGCEARNRIHGMNARTSGSARRIAKIAVLSLGRC
jgi:hypothetical protein